MDHADVLELIEVAAAEPDGLARLAAGDTPESAAVAGHLAGCASCTAELAATTSVATVARETIRELPDPALRARTLSFVREVGRDRPTAAAPDAVAPAVTSAPPETPAALPEKVVPITRARSGRPWWYAASIAAVLVAAVGGFTLGGAQARPPLAVGDQYSAMSALQTSMHIAEQPDAVHVDLAAATGASAKSHGKVLYSPTTGEFVMTATGLDPAPEGASYTCWEEHNGARRQLGVLMVTGGSGSWAGLLGGLAELGPGTVFGISMVAAGAKEGTPVLRSGG